MTQETDVEMLDYSKPPTGYRVGHKGFSLYSQDGDYVRIVTRIASSTAEALAAAWARYKAERDPPGMTVQSFRARALGLPDPEARVAAWAWHDRRHALAARIETGEEYGQDLPWPRGLLPNLPAVTP